LTYAQQFQQSVAQDPEIVNLSQQVNDTDRQIKDLEAEKTKTIKDIEANHP